MTTKEMDEVIQEVQRLIMRGHEEWTGDSSKEAEEASEETKEWKEEVEEMLEDKRTMKAELEEAEEERPEKVEETLKGAEGETTKEAAWGGDGWVEKDARRDEGRE